MVRLRSNVLQQVPEVLCNSSSCFTIALLNVRSILAKLPDIEADKSLRSASIYIVLCETWLNPFLRPSSNTIVQVKIFGS